MKSNKKDLQVLPGPTFFQVSKNKTILLDTSVFGDAYQYPKEWAEFFNTCSRAEVVLVTVEPVCIEFTKGSTDAEILSNKRIFVEKTTECILPLHPEIITTNMPFLLEKYIPYGSGVSITDFILAGTMKKYCRDMLLLTKNPTDFPSSLFQLKSYLLIVADRLLQCYGLYGYNEQT